METDEPINSIDIKNSLREVRKLVDILMTWGNCLVPTLPDQKETYAQDRLAYFVDKLQTKYGYSKEQIEEGIKNLD